MTNEATGASERHEDRGAAGSPVERPVRPLSEPLFMLHCGALFGGEREMYESPYQKEETEDLIRQVNELRAALAMCWKILPDGDYGADAVSVKRCMTKFNCCPKTGRALTVPRPGDVW